MKFAANDEERKEKLASMDRMNVSRASKFFGRYYFDRMSSIAILGMICFGVKICFSERELSLRETVLFKDENIKANYNQRVYNRTVFFKPNYLRKKKYKRLKSPLGRHQFFIREENEGPEKIEDSIQYFEEWQNSYHEACNNFHEIDMPGRTLIDEMTVRDNGYWRIGFEVDGFNALMAPGSPPVMNVAFLKVLRYNNQEFTQSTTHRARVDAIVAERVSNSKYNVNSYGVCAHSSMYEYAAVGSLTHYVGKKHGREYKSFSSLSKLNWAKDLAEGLADMHGCKNHNEMNFDDRTTVYECVNATIAHLDIKANNMLLMNDNQVKISDFNSAELLRFNASSGSPNIFPFRPGITTYIPPERVRMEMGSVKADIYSLGSVFFYILTGKDPYYFDKVKNGGQGGSSHLRIGHCIPPSLPNKFEKSQDQAIVTLIDVMRWCQRCDPNARPNAFQVASVLKRKIGELQQKGQPHHV